MPKSAMHLNILIIKDLAESQDLRARFAAPFCNNSCHFFVFCPLFRANLAFVGVRFVTSTRQYRRDVPSRNCYLCFA